MKKRIALVPLYILLGFLVMFQGCNFPGQSSDNGVSNSAATEQSLETSAAATLNAAVTAAATAQPPQVQATLPQVDPLQATASQLAALAQTAAVAQTALVVQTGPPVQGTVPPGPTAPVVQPPPPSGDLGATQTALAPIQADLARYGVDPSKGSVGWIQPPIHVEVNQYRGQKFDNKFPAVVAQDFTMSSDITWNTQYGGSGCAFAFRANGDQASPSQYMVVMTRLASGHVFFAVVSQGQMLIVKDFYAHGVDPNYNATNGATNHLAVVGRGLIFSVYTNGVKLGDVDPTAPLPPLVLPSAPVKPFNPNDAVAMAAYKQQLADYKKNIEGLKTQYDQQTALWKKLNKSFPSGFTALGVVADSGQTVCDFTNAWLWLIGVQPAPPQVQGTVPPGFQGTIPPQFMGTVVALTAQAQGTPAP